MTITEQASELWLSLTDSERHGVEFGLFPHEKMRVATHRALDRCWRACP